MAISGLHVGLAAAGLYLVCRVLGAPLACGRNVRDPAVVAATLGAIGYALDLRTRGTRAARTSDGNTRGDCRIAATPPALRKRYWRLPALTCSSQSRWRLWHLVSSCRFSPLRCCCGRCGNLRLRVTAEILLSRRDGFSTGRDWIPAVDPAARPDALTVLDFGRIAWLAPFANLVVLPLFQFLHRTAGVGGHRAGWTVPSRRRCVTAPVLPKYPAGPLDCGAQPHTALRGPSNLATCKVRCWSCSGVPRCGPGLPPGFPVAAHCLDRGDRQSSCTGRAHRPPTACVDVHALDVGQGLVGGLCKRRSQLAVVRYRAVFSGRQQHRGAGVAPVYTLPWR